MHRGVVILLGAVYCAAATAGQPSKGAAEALSSNGVAGAAKAQPSKGIVVAGAAEAQQSKSIAVAGAAVAQPKKPAPLYIVNGVERESIDDIPQANIESIEALEVDEQTIARYGERAENGVIIISLRYDTEAQFTGGDSFNDYIADHIKWAVHDPVARVVVRYTIGADGTLTLGQVLESTDARLRKKVVSAVRQAPAWKPATKAGKGVESEYVLYVQLPRGKQMPQEPYIILL